MSNEIDVFEDETTKNRELEPIERLGKWLVAGDVPESAVSLAKQLGYEGNLTVGELEDGIRFYHRRTTEDCIEMGKRLLLLKETTVHGEFYQRVELLGIGDSLARKFMRAAQKFANRFSKTVLQKVGSQTKFLELLVLDDDELQTLEDGGEVRGIELDAIECMSVSELRAALRNEREAAQKQINVINTKMNIASDRLKTYEKQLAEPLLSRQTDALMQVSLNAEAMGAAAVDQMLGQIRELHQGGDHLSERMLTLHSCLLAINSRVALALKSLDEAAETFNIQLPDRPKMALSEAMARDYLAAHTGYVETAIELAKKAIQGRADVLGKEPRRSRKTK